MVLSDSKQLSFTIGSLVSIGVVSMKLGACNSVVGLSHTNIRLREHILFNLINGIYASLW